MKYRHPFSRKISLHVEGRISLPDAQRQERTAKEILRRLRRQPGIILADEVGMGKTFVALAVAVSVAQSDRRRRPVAVMVPSSLKEKWPRDFELFLERCVPREVRENIRYGKAERAVEFLKLLDDPPGRRKSIIFTTHGALSRNLSDRWVMLALIYQALKRRRGAAKLRTALSRILGDLLGRKGMTRDRQGVWEELLTSHPSTWLEILHNWGIDPEGDNNPDTDDDPVPKAVWEALPFLDTDHVYESLLKIPFRRSNSYELRIRQARREIMQEVRDLWKRCLIDLKYTLPLLILDEAHHLKNPQTRLASLFRSQDAEDDAEEVTRGALSGVFERMLFLTATPFQLGHGELCSVIERFGGISWKKRRAPASGWEGFIDSFGRLRNSLDAAQESSIALDSAWGRLRKEDLIVNGTEFQDVVDWWGRLSGEESLSPSAGQVLLCYRTCLERMKEAERVLKPWVIRHLKPRRLPAPNEVSARRRIITGRSILETEYSGKDEFGIPVAGNALLPFLLAARATSHAPNARPVFAEGLASSYEAFLHTRQVKWHSGGRHL